MKAGGTAAVFTALENGTLLARTNDHRFEMRKLRPQVPATASTNRRLHHSFLSREHSQPNAQKHKTRDAHTVLNQKFRRGYAATPGTHRCARDMSPSRNARPVHSRSPPVPAPIRLSAVSSTTSPCGGCRARKPMPILRGDACSTCSKES